MYHTATVLQSGNMTIRTPHRLLLRAEIDQLIAEREGLASPPVLAGDEREYLTVHPKLRRDARERVEKLLAATESQSYKLQLAKFSTVAIARWSSARVMLSMPI